jgi:hypothetical protein
MGTMGCVLPSLGTAGHGPSMPHQVTTFHELQGEVSADGEFKFP